MRMGTKKSLSFFAHHGFYPCFTVGVCYRPLDCKNGRLEEFFVSVFLVNVQPIEVMLRQLVDEEVMSWDQLLLCEPRVKYEGIIL
jgi:hypothetical protein